jgi:hypothetical protein
MHSCSIIPTVLVMINLTPIHLLQGNLLGLVGNSFWNSNIVVPLNSLSQSVRSSCGIVSKTLKILICDPIHVGFSVLMMGARVVRRG